MDGMWIVYAIAALVALILVVRFGKLLVWGVLIVGGVGAIVLLSATTRQQAAATQQVATAATLASAGQTTSSVGLTLLAVLLVVVVLGGGGVILFQRAKLRRIEQEPAGWREPSLPRSQGGPWLPGPNAQWQRGLPDGGDPMGQMMQGLLQLEMLRTLREMRGTGSRAPVLTAEPEVEYYDEGEVLDGWW
ncbi:MAG: hypothetical protein ACLFU8_13130 [Anaerolineales bacterium]